MMLMTSQPRVSRRVRARTTRLEPASLTSSLSLEDRTWTGHSTCQSALERGGPGAGAGARKGCAPQAEKAGGSLGEAAELARGDGDGDEAFAVVVVANAFAAAAA